MLLLKLRAFRAFVFLAGFLLCDCGARADAMLQLFNLTWAEITAKIPEIAEAGYTSLWLPSPTKWPEHHTEPKQQL